MTDTNELAQRVAILKVVSDFTKDRYDGARAELNEQFGRGDRVIVRSPLDETKIGPVYKTDPKPAASVVDEPALLAWMQANYPEKVESGYRLSESTDAIIGVLFEHAPHLLVEIKRVKPDALSEIRRESAAVGFAVGPGGEVDIPGVEVTVPPAQVVCRPSEMALLAVRDLFRQGLVELDGSVIPELPEAAA